MNESDNLVMLATKLFEEVCYESRCPCDAYDELMAAISDGIPVDRMIEIEKEKDKYPQD